MNSNRSILILLVLYRQELEESLSYKSLCENLKYLAHPYKVLVYNNSPTIKIRESVSYQVFNASQNNMLVGAYNYAFNEARKNKYNWLLLLDQDSCLDKQYFVELSSKLIVVSENTAAILPKVLCDEKHISPVVVSHFAGPFGVQKVYDSERMLSSSEYLTGINSGAILRTSAIAQIGGFSFDFPLDFLDHWTYLQLANLGLKIELLDINFVHNLTISHSYNPMGVERYIKYLKARALFAKKAGVTVLLTFKGRTLGQCVKQLFKPSERKFFIHTFRALFY